MYLATYLCQNNFGLIKKKRNYILSFLELASRFKKLKRCASLEFCVHLDMSQIGIVYFTKQSLGFSKFRKILKVIRFYFFQRDSSQRDLPKRL